MVGAADPGFVEIVFPPHVVPAIACLALAIVALFLLIAIPIERPRR